MPLVMKPVVSSMISMVGYDEDTKQLAVMFNNGRTYRYGGVPAGEAENLMSAQSVGRYFADNIKNVYRVE